MTAPTRITQAGVIAGRLDSLSKLERKWLSRRVCGWCETSMLASRCGAMCGTMMLPAIEGVRDHEVEVELGAPCNMDEKRAAALKCYRPREHIMENDDGR